MLTIISGIIGFLMLIIGYLIIKDINENTRFIALRIIVSSAFALVGSSIVLFNAIRLFILYIAPRLLEIIL